MAVPHPYPSLRLLLPVLFLLLPLLHSPASALWAQEEPAFSAQELSTMTATLKSHYYNRAWELGSMIGKRYAEGAPEALELQAWYALCLARDGSSEKGIEVADRLLEVAPEDPWSWFAYAGSLFRDRERSEEALEASEKAVSLDPDNLDFLSLRADVIRSLTGFEEAITYIDNLPPEQGGHPLLQVRKAIALDYMAMEEDAAITQDEVYDFFRQVMALDTTFLEPVFFLASRLQGARRNDEALPLLRLGAKLSPSFQVHEYYWRGLQSQQEATAEEKLVQVEEALQAFSAMEGETPGALLAMSRIYEGASKNEVRDSLWRQILVKYPESMSAEWVLVNEYRDMDRQLTEQFRETGERDPELREAYRRKLELFLMRPAHIDERLKGDAFRQMLYLLRDDEVVDPEFLYSVVRGVELYEGINTHIIHAMAPITLADHTAHLAYAEDLARRGIPKVIQDVEEAREHGVFKTDEEFEKALGRSEANIRDALGWVYLAQGRMEEAEAELVHAFELSDAVPSVLLHLGNLYERRYDQADETKGDGEAYLDQAQDFYLKGSLVPTTGENPNDKALEALYEKRHGNLEGLADFLAGATATDAETRKERTLAARLEEPLELVDFELKGLDGSTFRSEELRGKVVVINFWGTWCGPCVIEMPEIQLFFEQYGDDSDVVFLTVNNDANPDLARRFMEKEEYDFPVLLDQGYVRDVNVRAFPTTWFVDPNGMICFEKKGWSEELAQEFAWRVEALKRN